MWSAADRTAGGVTAPARRTGFTRRSPRRTWATTRSCWCSRETPSMVSRSARRASSIPCTLQAPATTPSWIKSARGAGTGTRGWSAPPTGCCALGWPRPAARPSARPGSLLTRHDRRGGLRRAMETRSHMTDVVVLGASLAGLWTAAAAAGAGARVLLLDRDPRPAGPSVRAGVPQGGQPHVLLHRGSRAGEQLLPGLRHTLPAVGGISVDTGR